MSGRTWAAVIVAVVVVGAGAGYIGSLLATRSARPAAQAPSPSPTPSASVRATPSPASTASSALEGFPAVKPVRNAVVDGLHCRLPVYLMGVKGSGGFISFPDGTVTSDSTSNNVLTPTFNDWFGLTYDSAVSRWLPVPRAWVRPDGAVYVYATDPLPTAGMNDIYEINAQTGTGGILYNGVAPGWEVIDVEPAYVYATALHGPGLYVLALSGPPRLSLVDNGYWRAASGSYAYGSRIPDGSAIVRMDTRTPDQWVPWFNKPGIADIVGFDGSGNPVIWTGTDLWIASGPDQATRISSKSPIPAPSVPQGAEPFYGTQAPVSDSHGLWFSTTDGIYIYAGGQTTKVSDLVAQVAGDCR